MIREEDVAFLEGMKQTIEATYYYGPLHKPQRNSPVREDAMVRRRIAQLSRGGSAPQKASIGHGNYPGGVRRKMKPRLLSTFAEDMAKLAL